MPNVIKSKKSEIPIITSPLRMGMVLTKEIARRMRLLRRLWIPMAVMVPKTVDTVAVMSAMLTVLINAAVKE